MSGLALVASQLGAEVTGSDRSPSIFTAALADAGLPVAIGQRVENVPEQAELVISAAVPADNVERLVGRERGQAEIFRSDLLAELTRLRRCLAVAGTHGKTTTTAMLVHVLASCGADPAFIVGGLLRSAGGHARWGSGVLVVEADESDRSLLKYDVDIAVLLNAELDHHAHYADEEEVLDVFARFLDAAPQAIVAADPKLLALREEPVIEIPATGERQVIAGRQRFSFEGVEVELPMPGAHNVANATAALQAAVTLGVDLPGAAAALASFPGISRRFELIGHSPAGATIFDDYGHHPTEVAAAVQAAAELKPDRLVAVFQPHLFSRTAHFAAQFARALLAADVIFVCDVYPARERAEDWPGVSGQIVVDALREAGATEVHWAPGLDEAERQLNATLAAGDLCLLVGAGDVGTLGPRLLGERPA